MYTNNITFSYLKDVFIMIEAVLVDDEAKALQSLSWELTNLSDEVHVVASFTDAHEALAYLEKNTPDCLFLDIEMPTMDGFQFIKNLKNKAFPVVITTAYNQYALKALKNEAIDYLLKPIDSDDLDETLNKIKKFNSKNFTAERLEEILLKHNAKSLNKKITINTDGKLLFFESDDILYAESDGNYSTIYLNDGQKILLTKKLKEVNELLPSTNFFRLHNSYIVNLNKVKEFLKTDGYVVLETNHKIPVSRQKKIRLSRPPVNFPFPVLKYRPSTHSKRFDPLNFWVVMVFCSFFFLEVSAQNIPEEFKKKVEDLVSDAPESYSDIDARLRGEKQDTILMGYVAEYTKAQGHKEGEAYALNHVGRTLRNLSKYNEAEALHKAALNIAEEANSIDFQVLSLNWLAVVYRRTDAIKKALDYNQKALELAESVENKSHHIKRSINVSLNSIGNLYQTLGQYDLAIEQFEKALLLDKELNNKLGMAINHQNIGECQELKGELDKALENYRRSLAFNEEINSNNGRVICKNGIAQIYLKQNMPNAALVLLEPIKNKALELGDNHITSSVFLNLGWAQMKLNSLKDAEVNLKKGLQLAQQYNMPSIIMTSYQRLSELETLKGDYQKALAYFKTADTVGHQISDDQNLRYMSEVIERYESDKKSGQIAALAKENEEAMIRLRKTQTTYLVSALALGLLASILYILYRKHQSGQEKRVLSLEQNMLRSQMNPHFLFNSLNSIKLYIINNEQKNAVHYLNKFSKLVRKILEASSSKEISLAEELETVELYMNIENIRFNNEINFEVEVDKKVDLELIKIPGLALQPFLENALWHGLSPKEGAKKIHLGVASHNNGHITIAIEDNGVGRAAAEINKENRVLKRKSVGIDITKERLANFAKDYQNNFDVEIVDLFDDTGNSRGTRVMIDIPIF